MYIPDRYKTLEICDKVILENDGMLNIILSGTRIKKCVTRLFIIMILH